MKIEISDQAVKTIICVALALAVLILVVAYVPFAVWFNTLAFLGGFIVLMINSKLYDPDFGHYYDQKERNQFHVVTTFFLMVFYLLAAFYGMSAVSNEMRLDRYQPLLDAMGCRPEENFDLVCDKLTRNSDGTFSFKKND